MNNAIIEFLLSGVEVLDGVGERTATLLHMAGYERVVDIMFAVPSRYIERRIIKHRGDLAENAHVIATVEVMEHRAKGDTLRVIVSCCGAFIDLTFFRCKSGYLQHLLPVGVRKTISGLLTRYGNVWQIVHPDICAATPGLFEPVYGTAAGITSKMLNKWALQALKTIHSLGALPEWNPLVEINNWLSFSEALRIMHSPKSKADIDLVDECKERLASDEILAQQIALRDMKATRREASGQSIVGDGRLTALLRDRIGFELTNDQKIAISEITADQAYSGRMFRMLLGDVGSGKTIVALFAMLNAVEGGHQAVLLVPTEMLAHQHYRNISSLLSGYVNVGLLVGKTASAQRRAIEEGVASGAIQILVGTHAVFQEKIKYAKLGLTIIDEQHRFGVEHRQIMADKGGTSADVLFMSATPIPRSVMMLKYSYLDCSILNEKPSVRGNIKTAIIPAEKTDDLISGLREKLGVGGELRKVFWICPLIDESESLDLASANERFLHLQGLFGDKVGLIHGGIASREREQTIADFTSGKLSIIVATTVIEVGIDVPDADAMVIEDAHRFGLSQLHQLRGRVARGIAEGICILLYKRVDEGTLRRLAVVRDNADGFLIAEHDLRIRGGGELTGYRQSGRTHNVFFNMEKHGDLLSKASIACGDVSEGAEILMALFRRLPAGCLS